LLLIYDKTNGNIVLAYSGYANTPDIIYQSIPNLVDSTNSVLMADNPEVLKRSKEYRVTMDLPNKKLNCFLKPFVTMSLEKSSIFSGGIDSTKLTVMVSETLPWEEILFIEVLFNNQPYSVELVNGKAEIPITSTTPGEIKIGLNDKLYRYTPITLEVQ